MLARRAEDYRREYNEIRPHEAIAFNRPREVHLGLANPATPTFQTDTILPTVRTARSRSFVAYLIDVPLPLT